MHTNENALPVTQPTVSKHWRKAIEKVMSQLCWATHLNRRQCWSSSAITGTGGGNFFLGRDSRTFQNLPTTTTTTTLPASGGILRDRTPVPECEFVDLSQSRMSRWQAWTPWWCTAETRAQVRPESHDPYTHQTTVHISDAPRWIHLGTGASWVTWPLHTPDHSLYTSVMPPGECIWVQVRPESHDPYTPHTVKPTKLDSNGTWLWVSTKAEYPFYFTLCLQCFDAVGWVAGRASGL